MVFLIVFSPKIFVISALYLVIDLFWVNCCMLCEAVQPTSTRTICRRDFSFPLNGLGTLVKCFPGCVSGKAPPCQCWRFEETRFNFQVWKIPWRRQNHSSILFENQRARSLQASPQGTKESDTTESTTTAHPVKYWSECLFVNYQSYFVDLHEPHCFDYYGLWEVEIRNGFVFLDCLSHLAVRASHLIRTRLAFQFWWSGMLKAADIKESVWRFGYISSSSEMVSLLLLSNIDVFHFIQVFCLSTMFCAFLVISLSSFWLNSIPRHFLSSFNWLEILHCNYWTIMCPWWQK